MSSHGWLTRLLGCSFIFLLSTLSLGTDLFNAQGVRTPAEAKKSRTEGSPVLMDRAAGASRQQLQEQYDALLQMPDARVTYDARGIPLYIHGDLSFTLPKDATTAALALRLSTWQ